jgi:multidrug resistance efflux pump
MNTPNIDVLLSDITFRRSYAVQSIEVTVHDGDDTQFASVSLGDLIDEVRALREQRDKAVKRRREIDDEAFDYAEQIETLRTQLAAERAVIEAAKAQESELHRLLELGVNERPDAHICLEFARSKSGMKEAVRALRALEGDA